MHVYRKDIPLPYRYAIDSVTNGEGQGLQAEMPLVRGAHLLLYLRRFLTSLSLLVPAPASHLGTSRNFTFSPLSHSAQRDVFSSTEQNPARKPLGTLVVKAQEVMVKGVKAGVSRPAHPPGS